MSAEPSPPRRLRCRTCATELTVGDADALCPRCLLASALAQNVGALPDVAGAGTEFDSYELLGELGRGAMGVVLLARDRRLDRLVALKRVAPGGDPLIAGRLLREGQAVARMRHPNIVGIHALGNDGGGAFLAMDFLDGGNLDELLAGRPMDPRKAAEIIAKLAGALACAHAAGILHRDIKPTNILMNAEGEPHLADFGLAAPLEGSGELTMPGQIAGTAAYLAPELLQGAQHASPRSDLYALGGVLYACLVGRPPFIGDSSASILQQIATVEPTPPRLLQPGVPPDLATICLKCLEKSAHRRYASADELRLDLQRFLRGEPIIARPVGRAERLVRWARRNPFAATASTGAALLVLVLAVGGPLAAVRINRARQVADAARVQAEVERSLAASEAATTSAISDFLQNDLLAAASPDNEPDRDLKVRTMLDRAAAKIDGRFSAQPLVEAALRETIGKTYGALGDFVTMQHQLERALAIRKEQNGLDAPETLAVASDLVLSLRNQGNYEAAEQLGTETLAAQKRTLGPEHPDTLRTMVALAGTLYLESKLPAAEALAKQAFEARRRRLGAGHVDTLRAMNMLVALYGYEGKSAEAEALARQAVVATRAALGPDHPESLRALNNLAVECLEVDKLAEAETAARQALDARTRVLGPEHLETLVTMKYLADIYEREGKLDQAEALYRRTLDAEQRALGPEHPYTLNLMNNLAVTLRRVGKLDEARALATKTLEIRTRVIGPEHPDTLGTLHTLAEIARDQGQTAEAEALFTRALDAKRRVLGLEHPFTLKTLDALAALLMQEQKFAAAEPLLRDALRVRAGREPDSWQYYSTESLLGACLGRERRFAEAEPLLLQAHEGLRRTERRIPAAEGPLLATSAARLCAFYKDWGKLDKAMAWEPSAPQPHE